MLRAINLLQAGRPWICVSLEGWRVSWICFIEILIRRMQGLAHSYKKAREPGSELDPTADAPGGDLKQALYEQIKAKQAAMTSQPDSDGPTSFQETLPKDA
jgi:hypothetical protein